MFGERCKGYNGLSYTPNIDFLATPSFVHYNIIPSADLELSRFPKKKHVSSHMPLLVIDGDQVITAKIQDIPFASRYFLYVRGSFTEIILALAVTQMPFKKLSHTPTFSQGGMELLALTPTVYFHKEIREPNFDPTDPKTRNENGEEVDKHVNDEFLVYKPYTCRVIQTCHRVNKSWRF